MAKAEKPAYGYQEFFKDLGTGKISPCYVLHGQEEFVKEEALAKLRQAVLDGPFASLNEARLSDPDADAMIAANETLPMMAQRRLVVVTNSGMLSGKAGDYDEEKDVPKLRAYFSQLPESSVLVFWVRGKADERKRLWKALRESPACVIVSFDEMGENDLRKWLIRECAKHRVTLSGEMAVRMIFMAGNSLSVLKAETDKLCDYLGPDSTVDEKALSAVVTRNLSYRVFDLTAAVLEGDGQKAFRMLDTLLKDKEERLGLLALLGSQCRQLYKIALMSRAGEREGAIAGTVGMPAFAVRQMLALSRRYDMQQLALLPGLCVQTEYEVKSGGIPEEGSLEKVMLRILTMGGQHGKNARADRA